MHEGSKMEETKPIYAGTRKDFHWAGFGSGSGTNLRECAKAIPPALIFSDRPKAKLLQLDELADVPRIIINGYEACGSWKAVQGNPDKEAEYRTRSSIYNKVILEFIRAFEQQEGYGIDLIVLGGYMRLMMDPLLSAFEDKIINVHPADLSDLKQGLCERVLVGEDAVYDAISMGVKKTRSSVILVDNGIDNGEMITIGPTVDVWPGYLNASEDIRRKIVREYANMHQEVQKEVSDWPALVKALELIADGRVSLGQRDDINEWRTVYLDGKKLPYHGFEVRKGE